LLHLLPGMNVEKPFQTIIAEARIEKHFDPIHRSHLSLQLQRQSINYAIPPTAMFIRLLGWRIYKCLRHYCNNSLRAGRPPRNGQHLRDGKSVESGSDEAQVIESSGLRKSFTRERS